MASPFPHVTVVLAMSADGKIADVARSPARFGSAADNAHLEAQLALADGALFGANTLRAYGTTLPLTNPDLIRQRQQRHQPDQPIHIVCSTTGQLDRQWRFFRQPVPRGLITTATGATAWETNGLFHHIWQDPALPQTTWQETLPALYEFGLQRLVVMGGGALVASLMAHQRVHELWLTVCPLVLGGREAPTPVEGAGWAAAIAPPLHLISAETVDQEVFLHYRVLP
ncbi:MAG: RibD family protein [Kaiparowitsia implicata GSE-PSE-MK54-09C]|jgi:5-amino-6-(5-phosphoribosylamino)uracil reductase|nr:RibD family protein [Kaiparowitsia implicata GSE-PSE-MK54-09C]